MDTIFALASARGKAGVSVVRLSGPKSHQAVTELAGSCPPPRCFGLRTLRWQREILDQALVVVFPQGNSFTGEAVAELHLHGSTAVVQSVLSALARMDGLRLADPGEFTRRALENGLLDLTQVEGLADLIDAETEAQRRQAFRVLSGAIGQKIDTWRRQLVRAAALIEATIDFADEEVPQDVRPDVLFLIDSVLEDLKRETAGSKAAERIRDGFEVAIVGAPNAGKSTLLNALAGREAAITSEVAGTTRDVIEVRMNIDGLPVTFLDTAGLRPTNDPIEKKGIDLAVHRAINADLRIFLTSDHPVEELVPQSDDIVVRGKADLGKGPGVSGRTGQGIENLLKSIVDRLSVKTARAGIITRERHRLALERAIVSLESARIEVQSGGERAEIAADDLRLSIRSMESLIGRVDVESLLDEIFSSFCIGK